MATNDELIDVLEDTWKWIQANFPRANEPHFFERLKQVLNHDDPKLDTTTTQIQLPASIDEWTGYAIAEALTEGWIREDEIEEDCDLILTYQVGNNIIWIQRLYDRLECQYDYFTYGYCQYADQFGGSFVECVNFLNDRIDYN